MDIDIDVYIYIYIYIHIVCIHIYIYIYTYVRGMTFKKCYDWAKERNRRTSRAKRPMLGLTPFCYDLTLNQHTRMTFSVVVMCWYFDVLSMLHVVVSILTWLVAVCCCHVLPHLAPKSHFFVCKKPFRYPFIRLYFQHSNVIFMISRHIQDLGKLLIYIQILNVYTEHLSTPSNES